jgi:putative transposase
MGYSPQGFYKSVKSDISAGINEELILDLVHKVRQQMPRLGVRKLLKCLKEDFNRLEKSVGRDKLFDILRKHELLIRRRKRWVKTTNSYHRFRIYKNKLKGKLLSSPNQAYVSDITYIRTGNSFSYLFLITDAYSRKIVGWSLSLSLGIEGGLEALKMAIKQSGGKEGIIHHSDRGIQYCSDDYVKLMKKAEMEISMTEENHCYENAIAERVNGILKDEFMLGETWSDFDSAKRAVKQTIEIYNCLRPHMSLQLCTPDQKHRAA